MSEQFDKQLGIALTHFRKLAGMNQEEAARKMGIGKAAVSHYENGTRSLYAEVLKNYCKAVGCKVQDVFDYMDK